MGVELGRISGPLLANNLLRQGVDLAFETQLLYLDVSNGRIGVNTSTPTRELNVNGKITTDYLIVDTQASIANLILVGYRLQNLTGSITISPNQATNPVIKVPELQTDKLDFSTSSFSTLSANDDINIAANGSGYVNFNTTKVDITGNLHATGNVTWDGDIIIGDQNTDTIAFDAKVNSSLIPNINTTYDLGSSTNYWNNLYSTNLYAPTISTTNVTVNNVNMLLRPGHTIYVSVNGSDTNFGDHLGATFRTIKHALSVATSGDEIVIFPGTYVEDFPLTVPAGVTVNGSGMRATTVSPSAGTNTKDAFLLNGESFIGYLGIIGMNYDSVNNTGYAFRFANGASITTRSPYIQHVTVINSGLTSGRGALVDGSVVNAASNQASMLFHAVTFIIPNADGITATNGARVEWLNCFTYFAYRGIYLTQGTLGFASLGSTYGAEFRSINSANVYGTYGAVADGASTLGYIIGHNFGYIGSGTDSSNNEKLSIHANEVVEINNGKIYYDSVDNKGDFRVGDIFYINQETGDVVFNAQSINFSASGNITLEGPGQPTIIDATKVQTGYIKIHDNNIDSILGPVNFSAASGKTYLNTNVAVTGNVSTTGNAIIDGNVYLGNSPLDLITIFPRLTQNIIPGANNTYNLGKKLGGVEYWNTFYNTKLDVGGVTQFYNNAVSTLSGNTDLIFSAAGTGVIDITSSALLDQNLTIVKDLTVTTGTTSTLDQTVNGNTLLTGDINQTGDTDIIGLFSNNNMQITGSGKYFSVPDIKIQNNNISATATNNNIVFSANGTGGVVFNNKLKITDNVISNVWPSPTNDTQKSIIFKPTGIGNTVVYSNTYLKVPVGNNTNRVLSIPREIRYNSSTNLYEGNQTYTNEPFVNVYSSDRKTYITPELTVGANDSIIRFTVNNAVKATIDSTKIYDAQFSTADLDIFANTIRNKTTNSDLIFDTPGSGSINANGIKINGSDITNGLSTPLVLQSTGNGYFKFGGSSAVIFPFGDNSQRRLAPERGETRYNTQLNYMEVYNGTAWIPAIGTSGAAPLADVIDIMDEWALILG